MYTSLKFYLWLVTASSSFRKEQDVVRKNKLSFLVLSTSFDFMTLIILHYSLSFIEAIFFQVRESYFHCREAILQLQVSLSAFNYFFFLRMFNNVRNHSSWVVFSIQNLTMSWRYTVATEFQLFSPLFYY